MSACLAANESMRSWAFRRSSLAATISFSTCRRVVRSCITNSSLRCLDIDRKSTSVIKHPLHEVHAALKDNLVLLKPVEQFVRHEIVALQLAEHLLRQFTHLVGHANRPKKLLAKPRNSKAVTLTRLIRWEGLGEADELVVVDEDTLTPLAASESA